MRILHQFEKALLKLRNIKYSIRSRFSRLISIVLAGISENWEDFLSLTKATSLRVSPKVTKQNEN